MRYGTRHEHKWIRLIFSSHIDQIECFFVVSISVLKLERFGCVGPLHTGQLVAQLSCRATDFGVAASCAINRHTTLLNSLWERGEEGEALPCRGRHVLTGKNTQQSANSCPV